MTKVTRKKNAPPPPPDTILVEMDIQTAEHLAALLECGISMAVCEYFTDLSLGLEEVGINPRTLLFTTIATM